MTTSDVIGKNCTVCKAFKPFSDFYKHTRNKTDGHSWMCRECYRISHAKHYEENKSTIIKQHKEYASLNREKIGAYQNAWAKKNKEKRSKYAKNYNRGLRKEMLNAYGHACVCCGIKDAAFLTLEHIFRDGAEHRSKTPAGPRMTLELRKLGWPKDRYTLLCMNCNFATRYGDPCPHTLT